MTIVVEKMSYAVDIEIYAPTVTVPPYEEIEIYTDRSDQELSKDLKYKGKEIDANK